MIYPLFISSVSGIVYGWWYTRIFIARHKRFTIGALIPILLLAGILYLLLLSGTKNLILFAVTFFMTFWVIILKKA